MNEGPLSRHSPACLILFVIVMLRLQFLFSISVSLDLEALAMDDARAGLVVLLLADPHLLEGGERSEDGSADPYGVFPLWWGDDLDLHGGWGECGDFLLHTIGNTWVHAGSTGEDRVGVQVLTDVDVTLHDTVVGGLMNTGGLHT